MSDDRQVPEPAEADRAEQVSTGDPREDDRNDELEGSPVPDPEEEQGDAEDVPGAD